MQEDNQSTWNPDILVNRIDCFARLLDCPRTEDRDGVLTLLKSSIEGVIKKEAQILSSEGVGEKLNRLGIGGNA